MPDDLREIIREAFYVDGGWRDIYILDTDIQDWQQLLTFLHSSIYSMEFFFDGQPTPLPEQVASVFELRNEHNTILHVDSEHLKLTSFFFTAEQIEFDLDPRDFQGERAEVQIARLLDFVRTVGRLLCKAVILTPENNELDPLFRFSPETGEEQWFLEPIKRGYEHALWLQQRD